MKLAVAAALLALALIPISTAAPAADGVITRYTGNSGYAPSTVSNDEPDDSGPAPSPAYSGNGGNSGSTSYSGGSTYSAARPTPDRAATPARAAAASIAPRRAGITTPARSSRSTAMSTHSRVIDTHSYVYKRPRVVHSVPVVRVPVVKVIEVVVQRYHVVEVPNYTYRPVVYRPAYRPVVHRPVKECYGGRGGYGGHGSCHVRMLRVRG